MQKFYTDKEKIFECNVNVDGASLNETKVRLLLEFTDNTNLLFHGKIGEYGKCKILVPALKEMRHGKGKAKLEVIAESTYFESWDDDFEVETEKKVTVEVVEKEKDVISETVKPRVAVMMTEVKEEPKKPINPAYKKFKNYLRENEVNFNKIVKNKESFLNLIREYKKATNSSNDDITLIVEEIQIEAKLLKS